MAERCKVLRGVTGDEKFERDFVDVKVNVGSRLRVKEYGRKMKVIKVRELEKGGQQKEYEEKLRNRRSVLEREEVEDVEGE